MRYAAFYCEENVYQLVADRAAAGLASTVALITNPTRSAALWNMLAAEPGEPIGWDYHVIALAPAVAEPRTDEDAGRAAWDVLDLDSRLGLPVPFPRYAASTFAPVGQLPARFEPRFLVVDGAAWLTRFSSDRSHMRARNGRWRHSPPPWPPIVAAGEPSFLTWLDESSAGAPGEWLTLEAFVARFA